VSGAQRADLHSALHSTRITLPFWVTQK